jgi:hypothetical protein
MNSRRSINLNVAVVRISTLTATQVETTGACPPRDPQHKNTYSNNIKLLLKIMLKNCGAPMVTNDHSGRDENYLLVEPEHIKIYQMLVGCAQWAVTICRFDIQQHATNTLARFLTCPRIGHLMRIVRVFGHLKHHMKHRIEFNNDPPPDYSQD